MGRDGAFISSFVGKSITPGVFTNVLNINSVLLLKFVFGVKSLAHENS